MVHSRIADEKRQEIILKRNPRTRKAGDIDSYNSASPHQCCQDQTSFSWHSTNESVVVLLQSETCLSTGRDGKAFSCQRSLEECVGNASLNSMHLRLELCESALKTDTSTAIWSSVVLVPPSMHACSLSLLCFPLLLPSHILNLILSTWIVHCIVFLRRIYLFLGVLHIATQNKAANDHWLPVGQVGRCVCCVVRGDHVLKHLCGLVLLMLVH